MLLGLAVFLFFFCLVPWWRKVNKTIYDILGCKSQISDDLKSFFG